MDETRDPWLPYSGRRCSLPVPGMPAVEVAAAQVAYPGADMLALENISLRVPVAARVALVGPNGSGNSTLLKRSRACCRCARARSASMAS